MAGIYGYSGFQLKNPEYPAYPVNPGSKGVNIILEQP